MHQRLVSYSDTDSDECLVCVLSFVINHTVCNTSTSNVISNILIDEYTFAYLCCHSGTKSYFHFRAMTVMRL